MNIFISIEESFEPKQPTDFSDNGAVIAIVIVAAVGVFFFLKIRSKTKSQRSRIHKDENKKNDKDYGSVEIEINGGIEK